jgi:hypothetical protein
MPNNEQFELKSLGFPELNTEILFSRRPVDISGDLRPTWRVGLLVLLMKLCCRQGKVRFRQLHVLNWGIRSRENRETLEGAIQGQVALDSLLVRIEPSLNRAVDLAIGEGLIKRNSGDQLQLTDKGLVLADAIEQDDNVLHPEKEFMARIRKKVSEAFVDDLFG